MPQGVIAASLLHSLPGGAPFALTAGALALAVTLAAGPIAKRLAVRFDLVDRPDAKLKPHMRPIPYLGGVAIYAGWLAALVVAGADAEIPPRVLAGVAAGGTILMLTGLVDDARHLPPKLRLMIQCAVAVMLVIVGVGDSAFEQLLNGLFNRSGSSMLGGSVGMAASMVFAAAVLAGATNSTNLIDGLDGLCGGVIAIAGVGFVAVAALLSPSGGASLFVGPLSVLLAVSVLGACLAFLVYNFNPASMFMGDSGSLLLGFNVAVLILVLAERAGGTGLGAGLLVFGFPIFDTALAIARRKLHGRPLFVGDRSHFYDQLRDRGLSVRKTVIISYILAAAFSVAGAVFVIVPPAARVVIAFAVPGLLGAMAIRLKMLRTDAAQ